MAAVLILNRKTITVFADGDQRKFTTYKNTVKEALESTGININPKDNVDPSLNSKLSDSGTITIRRAVNIKLSLDGKEIDIQSPEENVELMLKAENISLNSLDKVNPSKDTKLSEGMKIDIIRVEIKTSTETQPIKYKEVVKKNSSLPNTKRLTSQEGIDGEKLLTLEKTYENGAEVSKKTISEQTIKEPVDKIITQGTYPLMPVAGDGSIMAYSRSFKAKATAYWAVRGIGKTYTASGRKAVWDPEGYSTIAVDPSVIPYGTKLFVEGYGFAIAADTGTAIKGNTVDVYFNTYDEACDWGLKYVNVYVLK